MTQLVLLDAQILISALDDQATTDATEKAAAKETLLNLIRDDLKELVITPLLRFEVMCGIKNEDTFKKIDKFLERAKVFEIRDREAYKAVELFRLVRMQSIDLKNPHEPKKYKFDLFHVASSVVNDLAFESRDAGVGKLQKLSKELK